MSDLDACRKLMNEYVRRMRMTRDEFAGAIDYSRSYVSNVLNGKEKTRKEFIERAVEVFAEHRVLNCRSEARELFALAGIDVHPNFWTRPAFSKLENDDPPESGGLKEQPQFPVTGQVADTPDPPPDKPQEQPTPAVLHTPLVAHSSGEFDLEPSPQTLPAPPRRLRRIVTSHKWAIAVSVILVVALVAGSSFIVWGLLHKAPTLPPVSWGTARAITCDDLFNPSPQTPITDNIATCTPTSDGHVTLNFSKLQNGSPELDVKEGRGPSGPTYRVTLLMNLSPTTGVPHIAGCIVMDTRPDEDIGEVVCVYSNGLIEVLNAATMGSGIKAQHLEDDVVVTINDPANVPVIVERVANKLYIEVANQDVPSVDLTTRTGTIPAGNIGFLAFGEQGSLQMSAIELA